MESWLLELLCLNAAEHVPKLPARLPHPTECDLYYINRDTLFSYHKVHQPTHMLQCYLPVRVFFMACMTFSLLLVEVWGSCIHVVGQ